VSTLTLHHGSVGLAPEALREGCDLVLEPAWAHGAALPPGTILDDHLERSERSAIDAEAHAALAAWRQRAGPLLVVDGLDLAHVAEVELLARCFVPAARLARALPAAMRRYGTTVVTSAGPADGVLRVALALAVRHGAGVQAEAERAGGSPQTFRWHGFGRIPAALRAGARTVGVPARVRGGVVCVPYWHLVPLYRRMARVGGSVRPVAAGTALPVLGRDDALRVAVHGGWMGTPGGRARRRSEATVDAALRRLEAAVPADSAEAAAHALALEVVRAVAADAPAEAAHARAAFAGGRARLLALPWDSPTAARVLLAAAEAAGVRSLLVQHGYESGPGDPDKLLAGHIATWSDRDSANIARRGRAPADLTVTGNPGATHLAGPAAGSAARGRTLVLVEYPSRLTARIDARVCTRQVATALRGLALVRPGTTAVVRPHPADPSPELYAALGAGLDLDVTVDAQTPIEALARGCDLVAGAISTATLQAVALGVPAVYLDVGDGIPRPWPFDGAPDGLPCAMSAAELADLVPGVVAQPDVPGAGAAREALGARPDAIERCIALIRELST
jgi:hypothetical protein